MVRERILKEAHCWDVHIYDDAWLVEGDYHIVWFPVHFGNHLGKVQIECGRGFKSLRQVLVCKLQTY
jgi:hypothetical protein